MKREPQLVSVRISHDQLTRYKIVGTSEPQGMVVHRVDEAVEPGAEVAHHLGFIHFSNIFNNAPFDNYIGELNLNPLLEQMISVRFAQDRNINRVDARYGPFSDLVDKEEKSKFPDI